MGQCRLRHELRRRREVCAADGEASKQAEALAVQQATGRRFLVLRPLVPAVRCPQLWVGRRLSERAARAAACCERPRRKRSEDGREAILRQQEQCRELERRCGLSTPPNAPARDAPLHRFYSWLCQHGALTGVKERVRVRVLHFFSEFCRCQYTRCGKLRSL